MRSVSIIPESQESGNIVAESSRWRLLDRLLLVVLLLAFAVRVYGLGRHGMTYDEAASVAFALPDVVHILTYPQKAIYESPPVFYLVLHFWQALAGHSQFALRFLSVLFNVLQVPLIYQLGRRLFDPPAGLLAALVGAVSVIQVYYAQEVRMYSLVPLLSLAATYALSRFTFHVSRFTLGRSGQPTSSLLPCRSWGTTTPGWCWSSTTCTPWSPGGVDGCRCGPGRSSRH
jgi:predicted membrane-bound mannosyltransferase